MNEELQDYLSHLIPETPGWAVELETQAKADHVPIMDCLSMQLVMQLIRLHQPRRILEVGTAIGYSALRMLEANPNASIVTIELDNARYQQAVQNIKKLKKDSQIKVIHGDALEIIPALATAGEVFDCIFIDAAKGQYQRFFEAADPMLASGGMLISDNVLFRGYVANPELENKRFKTVIQRLRAYNKQLFNHSAYTSTIIPIGDGVAISYKNNQEGVDQA
ncbi:O-methyltransferase [Ornithinibacillus gellani]|uniref:O-methyltransferase n=1 Tax=Ornithinibacillus gellani TaxID=2293253 RepID=UPI000F4791AD|nr:O-methyltransferase [Ornithinibacillus gellani]TQS74639.1 O-methyltransferase [Ornithinibacillus gellani]